MDAKGYWHNEDSPTMKQFKEAERMRAAGRAAEAAAPERPVISIGIGEVVHVVKNGGDFVLASFDKAEKNRVTLTPQGDGPRPYFELKANRARLASIVRGCPDNPTCQIERELCAGVGVASMFESEGGAK